MKKARVADDGLSPAIKISRSRGSGKKRPDLFARLRNGDIDSLDITQARRFSIGLDGSLVNAGGPITQNTLAKIFTRDLGVFVTLFSSVTGFIKLLNFIRRFF